MTTDEQQHDGARATIREVLAMVAEARKEILAEIEKLELAVQGKWETHATKHEKDTEVHAINHRREADRRTGYIRWAVTTIMTGLGVLLALYVAFKGP